MSAIPTVMAGHGAPSCLAKTQPGATFLSKELSGQKLCLLGSPCTISKPRISVKASLRKKSSSESEEAGAINQTKRGLLKGLLGAVGMGLSALAAQSAKVADGDDQGVASSRMSYSRFLEYLEMDRVKKVDLYENGTIAIVEAVSPELRNRCRELEYSFPDLARNCNFCWLLC